MSLSIVFVSLVVFMPIKKPTYENTRTGTLQTTGDARTNFPIEITNTGIYIYILVG